MAAPRKIEMDVSTEYPEQSLKSASAVREVDESKQTGLKEQSVDINAEIRKHAEQKIKSRYLSVDSVTGRAAMFDTNTYAPGLDYTADGLLERRWVNTNDANIMSKRMKKFVMPSEVSSHLKDITHGNMTLMVRPAVVGADHESNVEKLNKDWEAKAKQKVRPQAGNPIGEFEVTSQTATRG